MDNSKKDFHDVTSVINAVHLKNNSTLGFNQIGVNSAQPLTPDINLSSAYAFKNFEDLENYHSDPLNNQRYTRDSNEISRQVELYFSVMHGDAHCSLFNSGMSAVMAAFSVLFEEVDLVVTNGIFYRKTESVITSLANLRRIPVINIASNSSFDVLEKFIDKNILFFIENPSNPFLELIDIDQVKEKFPNSKIILDFSLCGLLNGSNMIQSADLAITSCTKYIGGHNDFLGGLVITQDKKLSEKIWQYRSMAGTLIDPFSSYLLLRSLRTYDLRIAKMLNNTNHILKYLEKCDLVDSIYYPGKFKNISQENISIKFLKHSGAVISFKIKEQFDLKKRIEKLCSIKMAPSFGSVDSLIEIPRYMSRGALNLNEHESSNNLEDILLSKYFCRLSVGCEPLEFLINDLDIIFI